MIVDARTIYGKKKGALETELSSRGNNEAEESKAGSIKTEISEKGCTDLLKTVVYEGELTRMILQQEQNVKGKKFRNVLLDILEKGETF